MSDVSNQAIEYSMGQGGFQLVTATTLTTGPFVADHLHFDHRWQHQRILVHGDHPCWYYAAGTDHELPDF
jgi:hypothetical protein